MKVKTKIFILGLICLFFISCQKAPTTSPDPIVSAEIRLVGTLSRTYTLSGIPRFEGYVGNFGIGTGYNCKVEISCYSDEEFKNIIDTANGSPANMGDIEPGQNAYFEAIAFNSNSHEQIKSYEVKITWLDRN